jgi:hypothetical protein
VGIEADVWLRNGRLWVGHTQKDLAAADRRDMTFGKLYVERLLQVLEERNSYNLTERRWTRHGVYETDPKQTLALMIDIKDDSDAAGLWPQVVRELEPLSDRGWLSVYGSGETGMGPITVVGTGNTAFESLTDSSIRREIFFDAPLEKLEASNFDETNSYYASASFGRELGVSLLGFLFPSQIAKVKRQVDEAHKRRLKVRYWNEPKWLPWVTRRGWDSLADLGVDLLNVDDLVMFREWWLKRQARQEGHR